MSQLIQFNSRVSFTLVLLEGKSHMDHMKLLFHMKFHMKFFCSITLCLASFHLSSRVFIREHVCLLFFLNSVNRTGAAQQQAFRPLSLMHSIGNKLKLGRPKKKTTSTCDSLPRLPSAILPVALPGQRQDAITMVGSVVFQPPKKVFPPDDMTHEEKQIAERSCLFSSRDDCVQSKHISAFVACALFHRLLFISSLSLFCLLCLFSFVACAFSRRLW